MKSIPRPVSLQYVQRQVCEMENLGKDQYKAIQHFAHYNVVNKVFRGSLPIKIDTEITSIKQ